MRLRLLNFVFATLILAASTSATEPTPAAPIVPKEKIALFNGTSLAPFYTLLAKFGQQDPDQVFKVVNAIDGAPAIRMSGQPYGGIVTRERYANSKLVAEYRLGLVTWAPRRDRARDTGILLHVQGEDRNYA